MAFTYQGTNGGGDVETTWSDVTGKPSTFPPSSHNHIISEVTSLQTSLDAKQATITGAASTIVTNDLTADRVLFTNGSGKVAASGAPAANLTEFITNRRQGAFTFAGGDSASNNTTTYASLSNFSTSVPASTNMWVEFSLAVSTGAAGGLKLQFTGANLVLYGMLFCTDVNAQGMLNVNNVGPSTNIMAVTANVTQVYFRGYIQNNHASTSSTFQLQFALNAASGSVLIRKGSSITFQRLQQVTL